MHRLVSISAARRVGRRELRHCSGAGKDHYQTGRTPQPFRLVFGCSLHHPTRHQKYRHPLSQYPKVTLTRYPVDPAVVIYSLCISDSSCALCATSKFHIHHGGRYHILRRTGCEARCHRVGDQEGLPQARYCNPSRYVSMTRLLYRSALTIVQTRTPATRPLTQDFKPSEKHIKF